MSEKAFTYSAPRGPTEAQRRNLDDLSSLAESLARELAEARDRLYRERCAAWGLAIGKTVIRDTKTGAVGLLAEVRFAGSKRASYVSVHPAKKDGEFSNQVRNWYGDWEIRDE